MTIHSTSTGKGSKTLVLVHGWTCDETSWAANVPELAKHYRVITLDLPGHGKSGSPKDGKITMDLFARAVEAVRAEQKVDKIILVGHSMGTPVIRQVRPPLSAARRRARPGRRRRRSHRRLRETPHPDAARPGDDHSPEGLHCAKA